MSKDCVQGRGPFSAVHGAAGAHAPQDLLHGQVRQGLLQSAWGAPPHQEAALLAAEPSASGEV